MSASGRSIGRRRLLIAAASLCWLAACNALPPADLQSPRLRFGEFRIADLGLSEIRFVLAVDTENPNDVDVPLRNLDFELELLEQPFASGRVLERALTLPALGVRSVPVEFTVPTTRLVDVLRRARSADLSEMSYRLAGSASWGWSGIPLRFDRRGSLDVLRGLADLLRSP